MTHDSGSPDAPGLAQFPIRPSTIRPAIPDDVPALKALIDAVDLFPSPMLDGMMTDYFNGPDRNHCWLTDDDSGPAGVAYCAPERLTEGT